MQQKNGEIIIVNKELKNFRKTQRLAIIGGPESDLLENPLYHRNGFKIDPFTTQNQTMISLKETQQLY